MADDTMVGPMVEKVARAIAYSAGARIVGPGQSAATREFGWKGDGAHFGLYVEAHWRECVHAAKFAMGAMREPTEAMLEAGGIEVAGYDNDYEGPNDAALSVINAMIDAALDEKTGTPE